MRIKREVCFSRAILWYRVILVRYARSSFLSSTTSSSSPPCCSCARTLSPRANVRIYDTLYLGVAPVRTCIPTHCPTGDMYARTHARTHARMHDAHACIPSTRRCLQQRQQQQVRASSGRRSLLTATFPSPSTSCACKRTI